MEEKPKRVVIKRSEPGSGGNPRMGAYILIGIGVFFLLANLGIIAGIGRLWPLILVAIGAWLLLGRGDNASVQHDHFSAPVEGATSARVRLDLSVGENVVHSRVEPSTLIDADVTYLGEVRFAVQGDTDKQVNLGQTGGYGAFVNPANWSFFNSNPGKDLRWEIGLNPTVATDLDVNGGVGKSQLDLSSMKLTHLDVTGGLGEVDVTLPASAEKLDARLQVGVGRLDVTIPSGSAVYARVKGGVGETNITTPPDGAVRVVGKNGLGEMNVAARFQRVSGSGNSGFGQAGTWETPGFDSAAQQIVIEYDGGVGQLRVR